EDRRLLHDARCHPGMTPELCVHHLERGATWQHRVDRLEHGPHAAAADLTHDPIRADHRVRAQLTCYRRHVEQICRNLAVVSLAICSEIRARLWHHRTSR